MVVAALTLAGCMSDKMVDVFTEEEFDQIKKFGPLGEVPPNSTNRYVDDAACATPEVERALQQDDFQTFG